MKGDKKSSFEKEFSVKLNNELEKEGIVVDDELIKNTLNSINKTKSYERPINIRRFGVYAARAAACIAIFILCVAAVKVLSPASKNYSGEKSNEGSNSLNGSLVFTDDGKCSDKLNSSQVNNAPADASILDNNSKLDSDYVPDSISENFNNIGSGIEEEQSIANAVKEIISELDRDNVSEILNEDTIYNCYIINDNSDNSVIELYENGRIIVIKADGEKETYFYKDMQNFLRENNFIK